MVLFLAAGQVTFHAVSELSLDPASNPSVTQHDAAPGSPEYQRQQREWNTGDLAEPLPADMQWRSVLVDGTMRRYLLSVPPSPDGPVPLVLAFHGLGQRAAAFTSATGLGPASRAAGEALAVPESDGPAFNDGRLGAAGPPDDEFALAVIDQLVTSGVVDPHRVAVTGFSNGAGMAMEVAAQHPGTVAAVVSVAGELIDGAGAPRPTGPVRACLVHGTADEIQPWEGRPAGGPSMPAYISEPATIAQWVAVNQAGPPRTRLMLGGLLQGPVVAQTWPAGTSGAEVTSYAVIGMGHRWPTHSRDVIDATTLVVQAATTASLPPRAVTDR